MMRLRVPLSVLDAAAAHLIDAYPHEACGWLVERRGMWRVATIANQLQIDAPARAGHRFEMSSPALIRLLREVDARSERLAVMFHSHVDAPARLSTVDIEAWAPHGAPLYPDVALVVGEVRHRRLADWRAYRWVGGTLRSVLLETADASVQDIRE